MDWVRLFGFTKEMDLGVFSPELVASTTFVCLGLAADGVGVYLTLWKAPDEEEISKPLDFGRDFFSS
jgi:hypothetical protein